MTHFYCPYCPPKYQYHKQRKDGVMICGQCGDPLIKIPLVKPTQVIALIAASAFIAPLIMMIIAFINDQRKQLPEHSIARSELIMRFNKDISLAPIFSNFD